MSRPDPEELALAARRHPGIDRVAQALEGVVGAWLVGGAVRDLLLGRPPLDIDVVVEGDGPAAARLAASRLGGAATAHERFGTATVSAPGLEFDVATARRERYLRPGALPEVEAAPLEEDLRRRDFTVNTFALSLAPPPQAELRWAPRAPDDLGARLLRVLHPGSFLDDPTRLLRLVRYAARLAFVFDEETATRAREAIAAGAVGTVSGSRWGAELRLLGEEPTGLEALRQAGALGLLPALHSCLRADLELAGRALDHLPGTGRRALVLVAATARACAREELRAWLTDLGFAAAERDAVVAAALDAPELARELLAARRPSQIAALARDRPPEQLAVAAALGAAEPVERWERSLRAIRLEIGGHDLLSCGVAPGPALGRGLAAALAAKLDGEARGRDEELRVALRAAG